MREYTGEYKGCRNRIVRFDSLTEVADMLRKHRTEYCNPDSNALVRQDSMSQCALFEMIRRGGSVDCAKAAEADLSKIRAALAARGDSPAIGRRTRVRSVVGSSPIVGAALAGDPRSMHARSKRNASIRTIRIAICPGGTWGVSPETIRMRGAAALALAHILKSAGFPVECYAFLGCDGNATPGFCGGSDNTLGYKRYDNVTVMIPVPINPPNLAASNMTLGLHAFFRGALFSLATTFGSRLGRAYTRPSESPLYSRRELDNNVFAGLPNESDMIVCNLATDDAHASPDAAVRWIVDSLTKVNKG